MDAQHKVLRAEDKIRIDAYLSGAVACHESVGMQGAMQSWGGFLTRERGSRAFCTVARTGNRAHTGGSEQKQCLFSQYCKQTCDHDSDNVDENDAVSSDEDEVSR